MIRFLRCAGLAALLLVGLASLASAQQPVDLRRILTPAATTLQSAATANGNGTSLDVRGYTAALIHVTGSMSGGTTLVFEVSLDDSTWSSTLAYTIGGSTLASTTTSTGDFQISVAGYKSARVRIASYSAGTITVTGVPVLFPVPAPEVIVGSSALPTGAATAANQSTALTSLSSIDGKLPALSGGRVPVDGSGVTQPVSAAALPLPSGAATSANQTTANTSLSSIDGKLPILSAGRVPVDGSGVTQPVSAASLPLPTGAATSANQSTANTSLSSIDTKLSSQATAAKQDTGNTSLSNIDGKLPNLSGGRVPVDGSGVTQPVSAASLPLPSGAATAAKQPALGTAGTPSADVLSIQGVSGGTALPVDQTKINGTTVSTGSGTIDSGTQRVTLPTDLTVGINMAQRGGVAVVSDPCQGTQTQTTFTTSSATTTSVVAASANKRIYICALYVNTFGTNNFNFIEGMTSVTACDTGAASVQSGSTAAASGAPGTAGFGFVLPNNGFTQTQTATLGNGLCVVTSGTPVLSGWIRYVQQ